MLTANRSILPNKVRLVVAPMRSTETVTVMILVRAGSRYETRSINGIAHFLEHMFFKGGAKYPDSKAVAEAIDGIGGQFNAFTWKEQVGYYVKVAKEKVEVAFDVLSDMLLSAKFDADGLERERGVILEEYNMYEDTPQAMIADVFEEFIFGDNPFGWSTIGRKEVIKSVKRSDFVNYRKKLYTAPNVVVTVAGNISTAQVRQLVKKYLPIQSGGKPNRPLPCPKTKPGKKLKFIYKKTEQAHLALGVPAMSGKHPDRYAARVLATILGGGMSSRLFHSVREQHGLAYYVYCSAVQYTDAGYLAIKAGVDVKRADLAVKVMLEDLKRIATEPVSTKELNKAKEFIIGGTVLGLEDSEAVAYGFGMDELLFDEIETVAEGKRRIRAVTAEQVKRVAKSLFTDDKLHLAIIGPYRHNDRVKKAFKL